MTNPEKIKVSVIIPAYNAGATIVRAIESVLAQTSLPMEIIVVDDGSTDDTAALVEKFQPTVQLIRQPNKGVGAARNAAAKISRGEWLAFLDADDAWMPKKLEKQIPLTSNPMVGIVNCLIRNKFVPEKISFYTLWNINCLTLSSVLVRRTAFEQNSGFEESRDLMSVEDYNLWLRLTFSDWKVASCREVLVEYTPTEASLSRQVESFARAELVNVETLAEKLGLNPVLVSKKRISLFDQYGREFLYIRKMHKARQYLWKSLRSAPSMRRFFWWSVALLPANVLNLRRRGKGSGTQDFISASSGAFAIANSAAVPSNPERLAVFPVSLICHHCGTVLRPNSACGCEKVTRLEEWNGLPRLLFGQEYWGECNQEKMTTIIGALDKYHWKEALEKVVPDQSVLRHLTAGVGPDFIYGLPWDSIETVLDIGAGMGFLTIPMARFGKKIVAVEAVPERALFLSKRAKQEGFKHVHPIIANAMALPFEPGTFDLITLNGVFEYIGLWGEGDPKALQEAFLKKAISLLRPNGRIYIGIETRYSLHFIQGGRDHSGLRYTSLMPRVIADWYCRFRSKPIYGAEKFSHLTNGYRTYCYTPKQYDAMMHEAGFGTVEINGAFSGYNDQRAIYPMKAYEARKKTLDVVNPPSSKLGIVRRMIADSKPLYDKLECDVLILASKGETPNRLTWPNFEKKNETTTQFSRSDKVYLISFQDKQAVALSKAGKTEAASRMLESEYNFLQSAAPLFKEGVPLICPNPLGREQYNGSNLYTYQYFNGHSLSRFVMPIFFNADEFMAIFRTLVRSYVDFCHSIAHLTPLATMPLVDPTYDVIHTTDDPVLRERALRGFKKLEILKSKTCVIHGDLALNNVFVTENQQVVLIDWETVTTGLIHFDLIRLLYDLQSETNLLSPKTRRRLIEEASDEIRKVFVVLGTSSEDYVDLEALFIVSQYSAMNTRGIVGQNLHSYKALLVP